MTIMNDKWIKEQSIKNNMIEPFEEKLKQENVISWGLSSGGYDVRLSNEFKLFRSGIFNRLGKFLSVNYYFPEDIIDPKNFDAQKLIEDYRVELFEEFILPPYSFTLAKTIERIKMPSNIIGFMTMKSTYARCGLTSPPTILEPSWEGFITLEIANISSFPVKLYTGEGIAQVVFSELNEEPLTTYAQRNGKYMNQVDITLAKIKGK